MDKSSLTVSATNLNKKTGASNFFLRFLQICFSRTLGGWSVFEETAFEYAEKMRQNAVWFFAQSGKAERMFAAFEATLAARCA